MPPAWTCKTLTQDIYLNINQLDALNFIMSLFHASTCFEHICSSSGGQKLYYTASGIITPVGGRPVHRLRVLSQPVHGTATYRCDDARGCIVQFWPRYDEHMCSKHVEAWNKLTIKFSASSWLILRQIYWDARSAKYQNLTQEFCRRRFILI